MLPSSHFEDTDFLYSIYCETEIAIIVFAHLVALITKVKHVQTMA